MPPDPPRTSLRHSTAANAARPPAEPLHPVLPNATENPDIFNKYISFLKKRVDEKMSNKRCQKWQSLWSIVVQTHCAAEVHQTVLSMYLLLRCPIYKLVRTVVDSLHRLILGSITEVSWNELFLAFPSIKTTLRMGISSRRDCWSYLSVAQWRVACENIRFSSLFAASSSRNVPSGEERWETDVFAG